MRFLSFSHQIKLLKFSTQQNLFNLSSIDSSLHISQLGLVALQMIKRDRTAHFLSEVQYFNSLIYSLSRLSPFHKITHQWIIF